MPGRIHEQNHKKHKPLTTDSAILKQWLRQASIKSLSPSQQIQLQDAVLIGIDAEWYEHDSDYITELGFTIIDPRIVPASAWDRPWEIIYWMIVHHVRIQENAHMINSDLCAGHPDKFQFGNTRFVNMDEASRMLIDAFSQRSAGKLRDIIFLGHAVDNDIEMLQKHFNIDWNSFGTIHVIDTQVMAQEMGFASLGQNIGLRGLLSKLGVVEEYLHNAGNDIFCTTLAALGMMGPCTILNQPATGREVYGTLKHALHNNPTLLFDSGTKAKICPWSKHLGYTKWCWNCEHQYHDVHRCGLTYCCDICGRTGHKSAKCLQPIKVVAQAQDPESPDEDEALKFPIPCEKCIMATDKNRNVLSFAYGHLERDCPYASRMRLGGG